MKTHTKLRTQRVLPPRIPSTTLRQSWPRSCSSRSAGGKSRAGRGQVIQQSILWNCSATGIMACMRSKLSCVSRKVFSMLLTWVYQTAPQVYSPHLFSSFKGCYCWIPNARAMALLLLSSQSLGSSVVWLLRKRRCKVTIWIPCENLLCRWLMCTTKWMPSKIPQKYQWICPWLQLS